MPDREKVIKGLHAHANGCGYRSDYCDAIECPYRYGDESCDIEEMCRDALELLKEQEEAHKILVEKADEMYVMLKEQKAVKPVLVGRMWECGNCHAPVGIYLDDRRDEFCRKCGKKVKWDEVHSNI